MRKFSPTHRTVHICFFLSSMSSPNSKTLEVKIISTANFAPTETHILPHLLLTNRTNCLFTKYHSLHFRIFHLPRPSLLYFSLQELTGQLRKWHFLKMGSRASLLSLRMFPREKILELTVDVCRLPNDGIIDCHSENFQQNIDSVNTVVVSLRRTRTSQFRTDLRAIFIIETVLESET